jgi:pimeloyl-ACP methyl ester carboxylesterase
MQTQRIATAPGVELAVDTWSPKTDGGRPAFVLVHGLASNARLWDGVAETLVASGHSVATVDLRGHGRSSKPDDGYDVPTVAADVAALIAGLGLDRPLVAGQSWGGNVVIELAARHPGTTRGIVCVDGGWLEPSRVFADWEACRTALAPPRLVGRPLAEIEGYLRSTHRDWPETGIRGALANFEVLPDATVAPWLTYERHLAILRGLWDHHPAELYAGLAAPVLLVPADGGEKEWTERKRRDVDTALAAIPSVRARWFRSDHDIHAQHPAELADVMLSMINEGFLA